MPKGLRERFKLKLSLDRPQRRAWALMEEQAKAVTGMAVARLEGWGRTLKGGVVARGFFLTDALRKEAASSAPDLLPMTVDGLLDRAWSAFSARSDRRASHRNRGISAPEFDLPLDQVVFSISDTVARVPYLGLVRYARNRFIQSKDPAQVPDNVRWLQQNVRRMWLGNQASDYFLQIDCTDEEEGQRRRDARAAKLKAKRGQKACGTASEWLDTPAVKDPGG